MVYYFFYKESDGEYFWVCQLWGSVTIVQLFVTAPKQLYTVNKGLNVCVCESRSVMSDSLQPHELYSSWNCPDQYTGVGSLSLLQGIFPTQGLNRGLPHCRRILYQLSYQGSPRYWVEIVELQLNFFKCLWSYRENSHLGFPELPILLLLSFWPIYAYCRSIYFFL